MGVTQESNHRAVMKWTSWRFWKTYGWLRTLIGMLGVCLLTRGAVAQHHESSAPDSPQSVKPIHDFLKQSETSTPAAWSRFRDASGVSLAHPPGWQTDVDVKTGQVRLEGTAEQKLLIWPVFVRGPVSVDLSARVLMRFVEEIAASANWDEPQRFDRSLVRTVGRSQQNEAVACLAWVPGNTGSAGFFYLATAPRGDYRRNETTFAKIVQSFQITGKDLLGQTRPLPTMQFVRWQDPNEHAFDVGVPQDWNVRGGMQRFAAVDTRFGVEAVSPDGQIRVYVGDAGVPPHTLPNPLLDAGGFTEGTWYSPGFGVSLLVERYRPGSEFASDYVTRQVAADFDELEFSSVRARDDASRVINAIYQRYLNNNVLRLKFDAGDAIYTCRDGQKPLSGYAFAGTVLVEQDVGGLWNVDCNYGYLASPDRVAEAEYVLKHMIDSYQLNPEWTRMQQHLIANVSSIVTETGHCVAQIIKSTYEARQMSLDEVFRRYSNSILDVEDVIGPDGTRYQVQSGSNYYWIDPRGNIIGTDTYTRPDIDFRELLRLP